MTMCSSSQVDDQFATRASSKVLRKLPGPRHTYRSSLPHWSVQASPIHRLGKGCRIATLRGLGCHEISHNFRKQRCIREDVKGRQSQSLALSHGTVVSVSRFCQHDSSVTENESHLRLLAPSRLREIWSVRTTTLTLLTREPEVGVQTRKNMRDIALISASLCNCRILLWNLPAESVRVLSVRRSQDVVGYVVLIGISEWCDLQFCACGCRSC